MPPILFIDPYQIDYIHSYGQDSPFFLGLKNRKLLGSFCEACKYRYATPRGSCMYCGTKTQWFELPRTGSVHAFTVCHFGSEKFLDEAPFALALVEFDHVNSLFLARLKGVDLTKPSLAWIGMRVTPRFAPNIGAKGRVPSVVDVWFVPAARR
jgi:uncharacterized OB-fold protein